jgi:hypothetical protein
LKTKRKVTTKRSRWAFCSLRTPMTEIRLIQADRH